MMKYNEYVDRKVAAIQHPEAPGAIFLILVLIADLLAETIFTEDGGNE